jgi:hypothetical protein
VRRRHGAARTPTEGGVAEVLCGKSAESGGCEVAKHARIAVQGVFHLGAVDILAAGHDHVLGPVDEENEALLVLVAQVTGAVPAVDQGGSRLGRLVPISDHDVRAAHGELSDLARRTAGPVDVNHGDVDPHGGLAARPLPGSTEQPLPVWHEGGDRGGLGGSVDMEQLGRREGGVSAAEGLRLLTRDAGRYATYFPTLELIAP